MKLLLCEACCEVFSLTRAEKSCGCGRTSGRYIDDINAEYGGPGIPLGFANPLLRAAIRAGRQQGTGQTFTAFVVPVACATFRKRG